VPVDGATLTLYHDGDRVYATDDKGQVDLVGLKDGSYVIKVVADGYPTAIDSFSIEKSICSDRSIKLEAASCSSVFTVMGPSGSGDVAVPGAAVTINGQTYYTDKTGQVTIPDLQDGVYSYSVVVDGREYDDRYTVVDLDCQPVTVTLNALSCGATFRLYNSKGVPQQGVTLDINGSVFTSDANGEVDVGILYSGDYPYSASWSSSTAEGTYSIPYSGSCPTNPYEVYLSDRNQTKY